MCGILGFWSPNGTQDPQLTERLETLGHRGPDEQSTKFFYRKDRPIAAMGVQRLRIVGLLDGKQPVGDPSGRWWVSLNGEIYNHQTLRRECLGREITPVNSSDTSVVAALLSFLPVPQVIDRLRGMFALAIYDSQEHELWLYRDRMGVKPLYWCEEKDGTLHWASELRALTDLKPRQINNVAVHHLLCFEYIPAPHSIFEGIFKLRPATFIHRSRHTRTLREYWDFPVQNTEAGGSIVHWKKSLQLALEAAVNLRLQADVEIGTLLSGGIDSATVTAIASQRTPHLQSFSVIIDQSGFTEEEAIRHTVSQLDVQPHLFSFGKTEFSRTFRDFINHIDEPLADSSCLVTWYLFEKIKELEINCVLSGDGADEIFAGYPTYHAHKYLPATIPMAQQLLTAMRNVPISDNGVSLEFMLRRLFSTSEKMWWKRHQRWMGAWDPNELTDTSDALWKAAEEWAYRAGDDRIGRAMFLDQRMYLAECVLVKADRMSMAHGIEVRSPFLDHRLVELLADVPMSMKLGRTTNKKILRDLYPERLSNTSRTRKKKGFGSPVGPWLRSDFQHLLDGIPERLAPWINPSHLQNIINEHVQGVANHRRRIWSALVLATWLSVRD